MKVEYIPSGTCARLIDLDIDQEKGVINSVSFTGGCNGNLKGISSLVKGMPVKDAVSRLKGITCGNKATSCPDQLATALEQILEKISLK